MSDSTETNELDNYGVWVKKPPKDISPDTDSPDFTDDNFSLDSLDEDLGDFDTIEDTVSEPENESLEIQSEETTEDPFASVDFDDNFELTEETVLTDTDSQNNEIQLENTESEITETVSTDETENTEEIDNFDLDSMEDGEIDLDNFLSDDSSDSSSEETVDLASFGLDDSSTDSVNLDDFLDGGEFSDLNSTGTGTTQKSEDIVDEDPLNINLSFDESANSFEVAEENEESSEIEDNAEQAIRSTGDDIDTESIDLAEFGLDGEESLMTIQSPEDTINEAKDETVNYDLKVNVDTDDGVTVSMSDVIAGTTESQEEPVIEEKTETVSESSSTEEVVMSTAGQEILQQLMGELSSLKNEIKDLKSELTELKSQEEEIKIESNEDDNTGFFGDNEEDDTIALSGAELDNILSSAEFLEETDSDEAAEESIQEEEIQLEENAADFTEETSVSNGEFSSTIEGDIFDDSTIFEDVSDDPVVIEEPAATPEIQEEIVEETSSDSIEEENLISEELPEEIEIPRVTDFSGESELYVNEDSSLTIDTTGIDDEISINPIDELFEDEPSIASSLTSDKIDYISEDKENPFEEDIAEDSLGELDLPSPALDDMEQDNVISDDEVIVSEDTAEEKMPIMENNSFADNSNNDIPGDLKQEIKSVLSYMDQLLENLPEEKITEFAQSEHFVTYKKLFQELGLS